MQKHTRQRLIFTISIVALVFLFNGTPSSSAPQYLRGVYENGAIAYVGPLTIQQTNAYKQFIYSKKTEKEKLYYLLSRFRTADHLGFYFGGGRYSANDACFGSGWILRHRYKGNKEARKFIREQVTFFEKPGKPLLIEFQNGSIHFAYNIIINELELLENTIAETSATDFIADLTPGTELLH